MHSLFKDVLQIICEWKPQTTHSTEQRYRDDLINCLRRNLNQSEEFFFESKIWGSDDSRQHLIKKEAGRSLADIGIDNEIGIELKRNLKTKTQVHRLVGQVVDYLDAYSYVIVVLCGQTKQEAVEVLEHNIRLVTMPFSLPIFGEEKLVRIVTKSKCQKN